MPPECSCPKRLAYGTIDSLIGKLRSIFCLHGRGSDESPIPGYGNPAASKVVKDYLSMVREEQLRASISPTQAQPFSLADDLLALSAYIAKRLIDRYISSKELYTFARDQAYFKTYVFAGDRAGDLGKIKTEEMLYFPRKEGFLFNHLITKSLRDGTSNLFSLKRYSKDLSLCHVTAIETYIAICDVLKLPVRHGFLFRPLSPQGFVQPLPFDSSAAQARLNFYVGKLPHVFEHWKITLHGPRNGCAISLAMAGADIQTVMDHIGWKNPSMAHHYIKLNQVLGSGGAGDSLSLLPMNITDTYRRQNDLLGFTQAFC